MAGSIPAPTTTHYGPSVGVDRKRGHTVPTYEMIALAEFQTEREIEQVIQDADDALMLEAWSRIDAHICAERVA